jgi:hypothetical protein
MSQANPVLTAIPTVRREPAPSRPHRHYRRASKAAIFRRHAPAGGLGFVILVLLYLSLNHLARGVQIVTLCQAWEGLAMAIGLDLLIVGLKVAMVVTAGTKAARPVARFANPALLTAFAWSERRPLQRVDRPSFRHPKTCTRGDIPPLGGLTHVTKAARRPTRWGCRQGGSRRTRNKSTEI